MSIKLYDGLIIKNADYKEVFNNINKLKDELTIAIKEKYIFFLENKIKKLCDEQNSKGFIDISYYDDKEIEFYKNKKIETIFDFVYYMYFSLRAKKIDEHNIFSILNSSICFFPNDNDILVLKYIQLKEFDEIVNKYIKLEDYHYQNNSDAPFEEYNIGDEYYVSPEDWEKRRIDWENVLLEKSNSIPSQNSIQLNLEYDKIAGLLDFFTNSELKEKYNININLKIDKD